MPNDGNDDTVPLFGFNKSELNLQSQSMFRTWSHCRPLSVLVDCSLSCMHFTEHLGLVVLQVHLRPLPPPLSSWCFFHHHPISFFLCLPFCIVLYSQPGKCCKTWQILAAALHKCSASTRPSPCPCLSRGIHCSSILGSLGRMSITYFAQGVVPVQSSWSSGRRLVILAYHHLRLFSI